MGEVSFGQDGAVTGDGAEVPLRHEARFDNPYAHVAFAAKVYEISDDECSLTLDFETETRTAS